MALSRGVPLTNALGGLQCCNKAILCIKIVQLASVTKGTDPPLERTINFCLWISSYWLSNPQVIPKGSQSLMAQKFLSKPKQSFEKDLQTELLQFLVHEGLYNGVYNLAEKL